MSAAHNLISKALKALFVATLLWTCTLPCAAQSQQSAVFFGNRYYGTAPTDTRVGDMNGDGKPDLVSASGSSVNVLLNSGDGTFLDPGNDYAAGGTVVAVALGDLNGDGKLDVAAATTAGGLIAILYNNGDGSLKAPVTLEAGGTPSGVVIADFNGDGKADIAISHSDQSYITIYLNQGSGSFAGPFNTVMSPSGVTTLNSLSVGDINADGKPDLAAAGCCGTNTAGGINVVVRYLNATPKGSMTPSFVSSKVETGTADAVTLVDIDKDGRADYLIPFSPKSNCTAACPSSGVTWIFNNSDGTTTKGGYTFNSPGGFYEGAGGAAAGDLNNDGRNDIVISVAGNRFETGDTIRYLIATGPRTFSAAQPSLVGGREGVHQVVMGDFNQDNLMDVATVDTEHEVTDVKLTAAGDPGWGVGTSLYCAPPSSGWHVCTPLANANVANTAVNFQGAATAPSGQSVRSTQLFIDGKLFDTSNNRGLIALQDLSNGTHTATFRARLSSGLNMDKSVTFHVGTSSGCSTPPTAGVVICSPTAGATVTSPVSFAAAATAPSGQSITSMKLYVGGVLKASSTSNTLNASVALANGTYTVVVNTWTNTGLLQKATETITVGGSGGSCVPSGAQQTQICTPAANATVSSPVNIVAGSRATSGSQIFSMRVYVDNVAKVTVSNPLPGSSTESINVNVTMGSGSHTIGVVTYQSNGAPTMKVSELVHVP